MFIYKLPPLIPAKIYTETKIIDNPRIERVGAGAKISSNKSVVTQEALK